MFWFGVGLAGLVALLLIWSVLGTALAGVWGLTFMAAEKRWGFIAAGNCALVPVWAAVTWLWYVLGGSVVDTLCFGGIIGLGMLVFCPKG